jgi:hypothetical protein
LKPENLGLSIENRILAGGNCSSLGAFRRRWSPDAAVVGRAVWGGDARDVPLVERSIRFVMLVALPHGQWRPG